MSIVIIFLDTVKPPNNSQGRDTFVERLALLGGYNKKGHFIPFSLAVVESLAAFQSPSEVSL